MGITDRIAAVKAQMAPQNAGFFCPNGWQELVARTHEALYQIDPNYQIEQVKEKFGGLRFYYSPSPNLPAQLKSEMQGIVNRAEAEAWSICEICGREGEAKDDMKPSGFVIPHVRCQVHTE